MSRLKSFSFTASAFLFINMVSTANILVISQINSLSHQFVFRPVIEELAIRGHHLTVVTAYPAKYKDPAFSNVTEVDSTQTMVHANIELFLNNPIAKLMFLVTTADVITQIRTPEIRRAIFGETKYDVVLFDASSPVNVIFAELLQIPSVAMVSFCGTQNNWLSAGNPVHPVLYGDTVIEDDHDLTFLQRVANVVKFLKFEYVFRESALESMDILKREIGVDLKSILNPADYVDMLFMNMYPILAGNRPVTPSTILLGGLHIRPRRKLPTDLHEYLDNSKDGVIYFSLGTFVKSNELPLSKKKYLLEIFKELPFNILWKFEDDSLENVPKNVMISKFFPQFDIFGHPNVRLFITHGGLQSMEEAILSGIPLLAMPFLWDQRRNSKLMVKHGIGKILDFETLTKDTLKNTIYEIVGNGSYLRNVAKLSKIIADQPLTSRNKAAFWIEYVIRHKGAKHLRPRVLAVPLYQYFMLDIVALIITVISVIFVFFKYSLRLLKMLLFKSTSTSKKQDKQKRE